MSPRHLDLMPGQIPMDRPVEVDEVMSLVIRLASADSSFSTGAVFNLSDARAMY